MHTFQDMVLRLTSFWAEQGCLFHQCYDLETGAATFNPITFLKVLGPEPYKAAYVEPCRRPQDGRYGQNPNRLQLFHQFQVILKPSPENVLDLYLKSLEAIGFDLSKHDIRFVHDDWESPTLGAWGLGWEVWIDGMEVTQFTYFQSVAGFALKPVTAEIAYGLERLSMLLQNKTNFFDMQYDKHLTYKDVVMQNEIEWSTYNFEKSDPAMWFDHFNEYEKEAKRLAECKLPIPAYDFVIKASHAFNMLEARGVISTTERTGYILRIRDIAKQVATCYIESREVLGYPLCKVYKTEEKIVEVPPISSKKLQPKEPFLFEIGCEMLPANYVSVGQNLLRKAIEDLLKKERLSYSRIEMFASPQRLAVLVHDLETETKPLVQEKKGPLAQIAFDENGKLTQQGIGFLKSFGFDEPLSLDLIRSNTHPNLSIVHLSSQDYLFVKIVEPSKKTDLILQENLPKILSSMIFPKNMRWGSMDETFARPIRWIVALLQQQVIPFSFAGIVSSNRSRGHAQYSPNFFVITSPIDYAASLKDHYVIANLEERKTAILNQLEKLEKAHSAHALKKERVLNEVVNLVEWPKLVVHGFDHHFLEAPKELLVSEMVEHQRYFPLEDANKKLKPLFVMTLDHEPSEAILDNNKKVLSARLSDGVFFYHQDLKQPLESYVEKLKTVMFQKDLGTIYQKVERLHHHANLLFHLLKIGSKEHIQRTVTLCKADLVTNLVNEFPELQGIVGKTYALLQDENKEVAEAIYEHWLPNAESGPIPATPSGIIVSLADKLDNLVGYYSIGLRPTSSSDPYALRRQTLGILKILTQHKLKLPLRSTLLDIFKSFTSHDGSKIVDEIIEFFKNRMKTLLEDYGHKKDAIEAVLQANFNNPYDDLLRLQALEVARKESHFNPLLEVYKRLKGQVEKADECHFSRSLLTEKEEIALLESVEKIEKLIDAHPYEMHYETIFKVLSELHLPLKEVFENVKILCDDQEIRKNRLGLLQKVYHLLMRFADFSKLQIS